MGRDGKGWEGMGMDGKGWEGMGKDGKEWEVLSFALFVNKQKKLF